MEKFEKFLDIAMNTLMSFVMLILTIFGTWQVFSRLVLGNPSTFTEELLRYLLIWAGMIGAAYCFFKNKHINLTLLTSRIKGVHADIVYVITEIIVVVFVFYVYIYGGFQMVSKNVTQLTAVLRIPMSIVYACMPVSGVFIIISKIMTYISKLSGYKKGDKA